MLFTQSPYYYVPLYTTSTQGTPLSIALREYASGQTNRIACQLPRFRAGEYIYGFTFPVTGRTGNPPPYRACLVVDPTFTPTAGPTPYGGSTVATFTVTSANTVITVTFSNPAVVATDDDVIFAVIYSDPTNQPNSSNYITVPYSLLADGPSLVLRRSGTTSSPTFTVNANVITPFIPITGTVSGSFAGSPAVSSAVGTTSEGGMRFRLDFDAICIGCVIGKIAGAVGYGTVTVSLYSDSDGSVLRQFNKTGYFGNSGGERVIATWNPIVLRAGTWYRIGVMLPVSFNVYRLMFSSYDVMTKILNGLAADFITRPRNGTWSTTNQYAWPMISLILSDSYPIAAGYGLMQESGFLG